VNSGSATASFDLCEASDERAARSFAAFVDARKAISRVAPVAVALIVGLASAIVKAEDEGH